jgi:hypothetical protein
MIIRPRHTGLPLGPIFELVQVGSCSAGTYVVPGALLLSHTSRNFLSPWMTARVGHHPFDGSRNDVEVTESARLSVQGGALLLYFRSQISPSFSPVGAINLRPPPPRAGGRAGKAGMRYSMYCTVLYFPRTRSITAAPQNTHLFPFPLPPSENKRRTRPLSASACTFCLLMPQSSPVPHPHASIVRESLEHIIERKERRMFLRLFDCHVDRACPPRSRWGGGGG